jgi:hypothetical protein
MTKIVDLEFARFERDAKPGVDACIELIEDIVCAGVADPISAVNAIFYGCVHYLLSKGCPAELLAKTLADAVRDAGR